jgi:hypothetical protein
LKVNLERGDHPEAATCMRKAKARSVVLHRAKKKGLDSMGKEEPTCVENIKANMLDRYKKTSTGGVFLW